MKRYSLQSFGRMVAWALPAATLIGSLIVSNVASAETAAEAAKKPVQPPKPYRMPDGHPNWSGFWAPVKGFLEVSIGLGGSVPGAPPPFLTPPFARFSALKSPYKEQFDKIKLDMQAGKVADSLAQCMPPGMPDMMIMIYGMELLQTSGQVTITSEWQAASRRVWLNQKEHTSLDELDPTYTGESIGHWEGDSLIVDTIGIRNEVRLNMFGLPHSDKLHIVETFTEAQPGILTDTIVVNDPDVFVAPWTEVETYRYRPDLRLKEYVCLENNRNVGADGKAVFQ